MLLPYKNRFKVNFNENVIDTETATTWNSVRYYRLAYTEPITEDQCYRDITL